MNDTRQTEQDSAHDNLEQKDTAELLRLINQEDRTVPQRVADALPQIEALAEKIHEQMSLGGRLFYIGAGTSGRLGILDASECPPTYGVPHGLVVGIIAGGDAAIRKAQEGAEDELEGAARDLKGYAPTAVDVVVGLSASGTTPYVLGGLQWAKQQGIPTGCIVCNTASPIAAVADLPVEVVTGPEFVTGSTRMKAGTAQKLVLNMLTTTVMIRLGRVLGNKMVNMMLTNKKLVDRGTRMLMQMYHWEETVARKTLLEHGSVRRVFELYPKP